MFDVLNIVLIGSNGCLKNAVGNALLGQSMFNFWTTLGKRNVRREATTLKGNIVVIRTPTWSGDLSDRKSQRRIREEIVGGVKTLFQGPGLHAILLVVDVNSTITEVTRNTLRSILKEKLWYHTTVLFANVEKLQYGIDEYIHAEGLWGFMKQCGDRKYAVQTMDLPKHGGEMTQTLEEMIAGKTDLHFNSCEDAFSLIEQIQNGIHSLIMSMTVLELNQTMDQPYLKRAIESKESEMKRLRQSLPQKLTKLEDTEHQMRDLQRKLERQKLVLFMQLQDVLRSLKAEDEEIQPPKEQSCDDNTACATGEF